MSDFTTHFITADLFLKDKDFSNEFKQAFYFGVQGPDIFFFNAPIFGKSAGYKIGGQIHDKNPKYLFMKDLDKFDSKNDFYKGYYFGVMLHFFGDAIMHQYIGNLLKTNKAKNAHVSFERDIDVALYPKIYNKSVNAFDVKKYYLLSTPLIREIYNFWKERVDYEEVAFSYIKNCAKNMMNFSATFVKASPKLVKFLRFFDNKDHTLLCHFKFGGNDEILNLDKKQWQAVDGMVDYSVIDIINIAIDDFTKNYNRFIAGDREFNDTRTFSYGCH